MDRRRPDLLSWQVGLETLLFDPATNRAHWLNPTAGFMWSRLDRPAVSIAEEVSAAYGVPDDEATAAVEATERDFGLLNLLGKAQEPRQASSPATSGPRFEPVPPST